jgi:hypothetical protein
VFTRIASINDRLCLKENRVVVRWSGRAVSRRMRTENVVCFGHGNDPSESGYLLQVDEIVQPSPLGFSKKKCPPLTTADAPPDPSTAFLATDQSRVGESFGVVRDGWLTPLQRTLKVAAADFTGRGNNRKSRSRKGSPSAAKISAKLSASAAESESCDIGAQWTSTSAGSERETVRAITQLQREYHLSRVRAEHCLHERVFEDHRYLEHQARKAF